MKNIKKMLIVLIVLLIIVGIAIIVLNNRKTEVVIDNEPNEVIQNKPELVDNPIMYFTVNSCVEKYINYLTDKDSEVIYNLLDNKYKKTFSITKENVLEHVEKVYNSSDFKTDKMYVEKTDEDNEIYYVKGSLIEITNEKEYTYGETKEFIVTVNINHKDMTFTVVPFGYGGVLYE